MKITLTGQFKKDLKKYKNQPNKMQDLKKVLLHLQNDGFIPPNYKPHTLLGDYKGCWECHVQNDFLLIWIDEEHQIAKLVRLGSHSELF